MMKFGAGDFLRAKRDDEIWRRGFFASQKG